MNAPVVLEFWVPTLPWGARVEVRGLDPARARLARERWPAQSEDREADAALSIDVVDEGVGLELREEFVGGSGVWGPEATLELEVSAGCASVERQGHRLVGHGTVPLAHPLRGIDALLRAVTTAGLALRGIFVLHASAVRLGNDAIVFLGASGAGKTTTARRLGREGVFRRMADDIIGIDLATWPPMLHPLAFERHRPSGATTVVARCLGGALIRGAARAAVIAPLAPRARYWSEALVALAPPPGQQNEALDLFSRLAALPMLTFDVPASGAITAPVLAWIRARALEAAATPTDPLDSSEAPNHTPAVAGENPLLGGRAVSRAPNVAWRVLDGVAVLVAPTSPKVQTLNEVGTKVWELADGRDASAIVEAIVNEFEVSRPQAEGDVARFVQEMVAQGFLVVKSTEEKP